MGRGRGKRNICKGVKCIGGRQGFKVHYARRCENFNLQKEGGRKIERRMFITSGDHVRPRRYEERTVAERNGRGGGGWDSRGT